MDEDVQVINDDDVIQNEAENIPVKVENDNDIVHLSIKIKRGLRKKYIDFCNSKNTDKSKRLRNFIMYELKKAEQPVATEECVKPKLDSLDGLAKPKDLNTGDSQN